MVKSYLEKQEYSVKTAKTGRQALVVFMEFLPDLVILDLMLPDLTGEQVCKKIKSQSDVPIIMLTAKAEDDEIISGLNIGADDYMVKPFSPRQLMARVNALLRRTNKYEKDSSTIYNDGALSINTISSEVKKDDKLISLTPNEYKILTSLLNRPSKSFTRDELISYALGDDFDGYDRTIDTHIKNLRQKIETNSKNPQYILTIRGIGYKFGGSKL